jgi:hypothetical protein
VAGGLVMRAIVVGCVVASAAACGTHTPAAEPQAQLPPARVTRDSTSSTLVPAGFGTLRQDDISIILNPEGVRVTALPLDQSVIRLLAPDTYRSLQSILEGKRQLIAQHAEMRGVRDPRVWYVSFTGLAPDARFLPTDFTILSGGREYRPFDVIPISNGFGTQRLQPRETQRGLLLFEEGVDVTQPLVVTMGAERNTDWDVTGILSTLDRERASVRARAAAHPKP